MLHIDISETSIPMNFKDNTNLTTTTPFLSARLEDSSLSKDFLISQYSLIQ